MIVEPGAGNPIEIADSLQQQQEQQQQQQQQQEEDQTSDESATDVVKPQPVDQASLLASHQQQQQKHKQLRQQSLPSVGSRSVCRICHSGSWPKQPLISPCRCKGSLAHVHLSCLERWLNQSSRNYCELCNFRYNAVQTRRYKCFQSIRIWIRHPRNQRRLKEDCFIFSILTVFIVGLSCICLLGYGNNIDQNGGKVVLSEPYTKGVIAFFMLIIFMAYSASLYFLVKNQASSWYQWWQGTVNIRLELDSAHLTVVEVHQPLEETPAMVGVS